MRNITIRNIDVGRSKLSVVSNQCSVIELVVISVVESGVSGLEVVEQRDCIFLGLDQYLAFCVFRGLGSRRNTRVSRVRLAVEPELSFVAGLNSSALDPPAEVVPAVRFGGQNTNGRTSDGRVGNLVPCVLVTFEDESVATAVTAMNMANLVNDGLGSTITIEVVISDIVSGGVIRIDIAESKVQRALVGNRESGLCSDGKR